MEAPRTKRDLENMKIRYELIDKDGRSVATNASAVYLGELAGRLWPDLEQDEDRTGKGWDVQVAGCE